MHPAEDNEGAALQVETEMPRYVSHKKVWALEIDTVGQPRVETDKTKLIAVCPPPKRRLTFRDAGYASIDASESMFLRYVPVPGDFYVVYADGYKSFSPRKVFLEGYTRETQVHPSGSQT